MSGVAFVGAIVSCATGCGRGAASADGGAQEAPAVQTGGTVLVEDQATPGQATPSGSVEAAFPGGPLAPLAQGVVAGVTSTTTTYDKCILAAPPVCSPPCAAGTSCVGPNSCAASPGRPSTLSAGAITVTGAGAQPLTLAIDSSLGFYTAGLPAGALLAPGETIHVSAPGDRFPGFAGDLLGIADVVLSQPVFPSCGAPLVLPRAGGLAFAWNAQSTDALALQLVAASDAGVALLDCRPADSGGAYTVPQAAIDAFRAALAPADGGAVTWTAFVRRIRDVTLATAGGAVHLVAESVLSAPISP